MNEYTNNPHVAPQHQIPLAVAAAALGRKHDIVLKLYKAAQATAFSRKATPERGLIKEMSVADMRVKATVIDEETGLFVTLAGPVAVHHIDGSDATWDAPPTLACGKLVALEQRNAQLSNTAVKQWR